MSTNWTLNYYFRHPHAGDDVALVVELIGNHSIELRTNITRNHYGLLFSLEDAKHVRLTEQIGSPALMWHHVALIFSSGSARLLVDGINVSSVVTEANIIGKDIDMSISLVSNDGNSNAQVAELVIFGRALSTDEIYKCCMAMVCP